MNAEITKVLFEMKWNGTHADYQELQAEIKTYLQQESTHHTDAPQLYKLLLRIRLLEDSNE